MGDTIPPKIIYRASGLGGCSKAQIAGRLGFDPLPPTSAVRDLFREGDLHEEAVVRWLREQGWEIWDQQREVEIAVTNEVSVVGHIDGVGRVDDLRGDRLVEIKSMGDSSWNDLVRMGWNTPGLIQKYKWQISAYMLATRLEGYLVAKNRNNGKHHSLGVELPFYSLVDIRERVLRMEGMARRGDLPSECDSNNYPCPFLYLHEEAEAELVTDEVVGELARVYKNAQVQEKVAKERFTAARVALKKSLGDRQKVLLESGTRITVFEANNPPSYDHKKMMEDGIDVEKYMTRGKSERMRVTVKEDEDGVTQGPGE